MAESFATWASKEVTEKIFLVTLSPNNIADGDSWTEKGSDTLPTSRRLHQCLVYKEKMWIIGGYVGSASRKVYYSTDGETWTEAGTDALPVATYAHTCLVYDGKMWVIGGYTTSAVRKVYYSTDGETWTEAGSDALPVATYYHVSLVFDNKMWVIGGIGVAETRKVYYSTDGETWTEKGTNSLPVALRNGAGCVYDEKMWFTGGYTGAANAQTVYYSTDGETWTEKGTNSLPSAISNHQCLVYNNKMWQIGGYVSSSIKKVYYSTDGETWTEAGTNALIEPIYYHQCLVYKGKMWTIGGYTGVANSQKVTYSTLDTYYLTNWGGEQNNDWSHYYDPRISSMPSYKQYLTELFYGASILSWGSMTINNADGEFDSVITGNWIDGDITIRVGGLNVLYSNYKLILDGTYRFASANRNSFTIDIFDNQKDLFEKEIPPREFEKGAYPNIADSLVGKPIPLCYGILKNISPINTSYKGTTSKTTVLSASINDTNTSFASDGSGDISDFPIYGGIVLIDDEVLQYTVRSGNSFTTVTRGKIGTDPDGHSSGATITLLAGIEYKYHDTVSTGNAAYPESIWKFTLGKSVYSVHYFGSNENTALLNEDVSIGETAIDIDNVTGSVPSPGGYFIVDQEVIRYDSFTDNGGGSYTLNSCTRGEYSTTDATHSNNAKIWFRASCTNAATTLVVIHASGIYGVTNSNWARLDSSGNLGMSSKLSAGLITYTGRSTNFLTGVGNLPAAGLGTATSFWGLGSSMYSASHVSGDDDYCVFLSQIKTGGDFSAFSSAVNEGIEQTKVFFKVGSEIMGVYKYWKNYPLWDSYLGCGQIVLGGKVFKCSYNSTSYRGMKGTTAAVHSENNVIYVESPIVWSVRDNGVWLERKPSDADAPAPGEYYIDATNGKIYLGSIPSGKLTLEVAGDYFEPNKYAFWHRIMEELIVNFTDLTSSDIDESSLEWLDYNAPHEIGLYLTEKRKVKDVLDMICIPLLGWYGMDRNRTLMIRKINAWDYVGWVHSSTTCFSEWTITNDMIFDIQIKPSPLYLNKINFKWNKNWTIQSKDELATSLTPQEKDKYELDYQTYTIDKKGSRYGVEKTVESLLVDDVDNTSRKDECGILASQWIDHYDNHRKIIQVKIKQYAFLISLGDLVTLSCDRYNIDSEDYQCVGIEENYNDSMVSLTLFGNLTYS